jgi:hypothetical protein
MKKVGVLVTIAVLLLTIPSVALAGESWVFSDRDELNIKKAIKAADPDRQIEVSFSENYWNGSLVDCKTLRREESVQIFVYASGDVNIIAIGSDEKKTREFAEKIKNRVEAFFNRPASEELGRDLIK